MFLGYFMSGIIGGVIGGMGMGGGTVLIPLLTVVFGVSQHVSQAVNLIAFLPMAIVALYFHAKKGLIKKDKILYIILSGLLTCVLGAVAAKNIDGSLLKRFFGLFLIILSIFQFVSVFKNRKLK